MLEIQPLSDAHERSEFNSGEVDLDRYLRETAGQHARRDLARTFVLVDDEAPFGVLGYFTLTLCTAASSDLSADLARKLPRTLPGVKLGRLAVDRNHQNKGHGARLLMRALRESVGIADRAGSYALFVDAKHSGVVPFYRAFGFIPLPSQKLVLFLPTAAIRRLVLTRNQLS